MIRVVKRASVPEKLATAGVDATQRFCQEHDSGKREFAFDKNLYGHKTVKDAMVEDQFGKCCFCERKVGSDSDVEHFRPKSSVCQESHADRLTPGYYWLVYDWDNLFVCCRQCNQWFKRDFFPLRDATQRARSHHDNLALESPLLIHPTQDDAEAFIGWRDDVPYPINNSEQARHTLEILQLRKEDRPPQHHGDLQATRRDHLQLLQSLCDILQLAPTVEVEFQARDLLARMQSNQEVFAAMTRAFCAARGIA
ncbi:hypothetical protein [Armatimonas sp.]|uniref:hypothetical protein n=1 Tax=Armatimonas sp. TaxID=1872638 RepID=UPI003750EF8C